MSSNGGVITVVVATRDRPSLLAECLESLRAQTLRPARLVVVDSAPAGEATRRLLGGPCGEGVVYRRTRAPGLALAHNVGLEEVETPLVAFTDDDVIAEPDWLARLVGGFGAAERVACVTGRIVPRELETRPQVWLDRYAAFDKGGERRVFDLAEHRPADPLFPFAAGALGSGANMAFDVEVLRAMGGFDPALGAGTRARGGDDLAAFFEVLMRGHRLVYEPAATVRHRHRADYPGLRRQVFGYGVGLTAYLTKCAVDRPSVLRAALPLLPRAAAHALGRRSPRNARVPDDFPRELSRLERVGMLVGPVAYLRSRRAAATAEAAP